MNKTVWEKMIFGLCVFALMQTVANASNIGLSTHMAHTHTNNTETATLRLVNEMETEWIRDELRWGWGMEATTKGELRMPTANWVDAAQRSGVNSLITLGLGNTLYNDINNVDDTVGIYVPTTNNKEYFDAFINYVKFVAENCKGKVKAYEIWNEPNHKDSNYQISKNKYSYSASDYCELLKASYEAIKTIDPEAMVVGGSFLFGGTVDSGWLETLFSNGAGAYMDAFSVHIYSYKRSGTIETELRKSLDRAEAVMKRYNYNGELWLTETGYFTGTAQYSVSEAEQASLLIRSKLVWDNYQKETGRSGEYFCYTLRDSGDDITKGGNNFGLTSYGYKKKPSFYAGQTFNKVMKDKMLSSFSDNGEAIVAQYVSDNTDGRTDVAYAAYSRGETTQVNIPLEGHISYAYNMNGDLIDTVKNSDTYTAAITGEPVFIHSVDPGVQLTELKYDRAQNICSVKGKADYLESVTVELVNDAGDVIQTENIKVDKNGIYSDFFTVNADGKYTVKVGRPELEEYDSDQYASQGMEMYRSSSAPADMLITCTADNVGDSLRVRLTGNAAECKNETINIMVMPEGVERSEISKAAYIGDVKTDNNGSFDLVFDISQKPEHIYNYRLFARGNRTSISESSVNHYLKTDDIVTYDFTLKLSSDSVTATAVMESSEITGSEVVIVISQYGESGELVKVSTQMCQVQNEKKSISCEAEKAAGAVSWKSFILKDFETIKPLVPSIGAE